MSQQQDTAHKDARTNDHVRKASVGKGLFTLITAVVVVGSYIALNYVLAIADMWVGFLFALYWGGLERSNFKKLPDCIVGAAVGLTVAYFLHALPLALGAAALAPCIAGVIVMVFFQIMGWFVVAINMTTMLFLTVATIPSIQASSQYPQLMISMTLGALYFSIVVWIANQISRRLANTTRLTSSTH